VAHEYAHARTALWQGDDTAYMLGRVTMNPLVHIDPFMSVLVPALLWFATSGQWTFGAARPVPVVPRKYRNYVRGDLLVSAAGVVTNFCIALACTLLFVVWYQLAAWVPGLSSGLAILQRMMIWGISLNLILCFFNLIPIPPLDGSHLLYHALPPAWGARLRQIGNFGFLPLMLLLWLLPGVTSFLLTPAFVMARVLLRLVAPYGIPTGE
jgi:Zn-dependent protease